MQSLHAPNATASGGASRYAWGAYDQFLSCSRGALTVVNGRTGRKQPWMRHGNSLHAPSAKSGFTRRMRLALDVCDACMDARGAGEHSRRTRSLRARHAAAACGAGTLPAPHVNAVNGCAAYSGCMRISPALARLPRWALHGLRSDFREKAMVGVAASKCLTSDCHWNIIRRMHAAANSLRAGLRQISLSDKSGALHAAHASLHPGRPLAGRFACSRVRRRRTACARLQRMRTGELNRPPAATSCA